MLVTLVRSSSNRSQTHSRASLEVFILTRRTRVGNSCLAIECARRSLSPPSDVLVLCLGLSSVQVGDTTKKGKRSQQTKKYDPRDVRKKQSKADRELRAMKVTETWEASVTKTHKTPPPRSRGGARAVTSDVKLKDAADDDGQLV